MNAVTNNLSTPVVLAFAGPRVEVLPLGFLRRLRSTLKHHRLLVYAISGQATVYELDARKIEATYVAEHGRHEDNARHVAAISAAVFRALAEGQTVPVLHKHGKGTVLEEVLE